MLHLEEELEAFSVAYFSPQWETARRISFKQPASCSPAWGSVAESQPLRC